MEIHFLNMILGGFAYVMTVYFIMKIIRHKMSNSGKDDEGEGGINIHTLPEIDLPPGITLPDGSSPSNKREEPEEVYA